MQNQRDEVRLMGGDGQIAGALSAEAGAKQTCYDMQTANAGANGSNVCEDVAYTLDTGCSQAVVCLSNDADATIGDDLCSTLKASADKGAPMVCITDNDECLAGALCARDWKSIGNQDIGNGHMVGVIPECWCVAPAFSKRPGQQIATSNDGLSYALTRSGVPRVFNGQAGVRRLTPTECERLQGFPDGMTQLGGTPDGSRYKALGNSMAVPVIRWLGERMEMIDSI